MRIASPAPRLLRGLSLAALVAATACSAGDVPGADGGDTTAPDLAPACARTALRPPALFGHQGVYDPVGNRVLVYGGDTAPFDPSGMTPSAYVGDLWIWDAACGNWSLAPASASTPGARGLYAAALDARRHRLLLVGGRSRTGSAYVLHNDVWSLDLATLAWTKLSPSGTAPSPRQSHRVVWDAQGDRLLLFGGNAGKLFGDSVLGDTWSLAFAAGSDGAWSKLPATGPSARQDVATSLAPTGDAWVIAGGAEDFSTYHHDTWVYAFGADAWTEAKQSGSAPSDRFWGMMTLAPDGKRLLHFGGHDAGNIGLRNDTWGLTVPTGAATWTDLLDGDADLGVGNVDTASPERRDKATFVTTPGGLFLFGGVSDCGPLDDAWMFDAQKGAWTNPWAAQTGETCARRAKANQTCPDDCGAPQ